VSVRHTFKNKLKSQLEADENTKAFFHSKSNVPEELTRAEYMRNQRAKRLEINKVLV
jgi:hypothetical protein